MIQTFSWFAAFWTAVFLFEIPRQRRAAQRFVSGLAVGAATAHLGWALLHARALADRPWGLLDPASGFCVLFLPLGIWLLAPTAQAFRTLPLALAVARLGCWIGGCCGGREGEPTQAVELAGLIGLHAVLRRQPDSAVVPAFWIGFGLIRLVVSPWRALPPLGAPLFDPAWIALGWVIVGMVALPSSATSGGYAGSPRAMSGST